MEAIKRAIKEFADSNMAYFSILLASSATFPIFMNNLRNHVPEWLNVLLSILQGLGIGLHINGLIRMLAEYIINQERERMIEQRRMAREHMTEEIRRRTYQTPAAAGKPTGGNMPPNPKNMPAPDWVKKIIANN